jgi:large subunit ribosomal protein L10
MTKEEKALVIDELASKVAATNYLYLTDASGLTVLEVNDFRRKCFDAGVEYKVYKNTLIKKAFDKNEADYSDFDSVLKGFTGIIFSPESSNVPAKVIKEIRKSSDKPLLKGAWIDSDVFIGDENIEVLSNLKSKTELIGEVIGLLQSPAKNVISALQSGGDTLAGLLKTLSEKEEA